MSGIIKDNEGRSSGLVKSTTVTAYDDDKVQSNIALLGFKTAVNGSLAKYNLQDQIIDEYEDATGIDAGNSTNEILTSGGYLGGTTPTITQDADATGTDGLYTWYKWTDTAATGSYETDTTQDHEWLVVAGGGAGGNGHSASNMAGGGGGAGGYRTGASLSLTGGNEYTVTVGAGGAGVTGDRTTAAPSGSNSILSGTGITTITSTGGGGGGCRNNSTGAPAQDGADGGSGGGASYQGDGGSATSITPITGETTTVQGYASVAAVGNGSSSGGGAGAVGIVQGDVAGAIGGVGTANDIIETGTDVYYAGGGGSGSGDSNTTQAAGGNGGGGAGGNYTGDNATAGTANTGGGGGSGGNSQNGKSGGSGIVILRRLTNNLASAGGDLTLQSTANTASSAATKADLIMLMENQEGTATINTDIKGYVTADGGSNWTEGTLVDEGSWGTNKKIYAFHDATVTSGTDLRYKITTHNQSEDSLETKIHATSLGWKA